MHSCDIFLYIFMPAKYKGKSILCKFLKETCWCFVVVIFHWLCRFSFTHIVCFATIRCYWYLNWHLREFAEIQLQINLAYRIHRILLPAFPTKSIKSLNGFLSNSFYLWHIEAIQCQKTTRINLIYSLGLKNFKRWDRGARFWLKLHGMFNFPDLFFRNIVIFWKVFTTVENSDFSENGKRFSFFIYIFQLLSDLKKN